MHGAHQLHHGSDGGQRLLPFLEDAVMLVAGQASVPDILGALRRVLAELLDAADERIHEIGGPRAGLYLDEDAAHLPRHELQRLHRAGRGHDGEEPVRVELVLGLPRNARHERLVVEPQPFRDALAVQRVAAKHAGVHALAQ